MKIYTAIGPVHMPGAASSGGGAPVDENSTIPFSIGCDEDGVYMVFEEEEQE